MFLDSNPVYAGELLLQKIDKLIFRARSARIHIVYIQHNAPKGKLLEKGTSNWELHPSLAPIIGELIVQKNTPDPFYQTSLHEELSSRGVSKLFVAGIQSEACVDTACRQAFALGYEVTLVKDAHTTMDSTHLTAPQIIEHHNQVLRWFARVIEASEIEFI